MGKMSFHGLGRLADRLHLGRKARLALAGGAVLSAMLAIWVALQPGMPVREYAAQKVDSATKGTPLEGSGSFFREDNSTVVRHAVNDRDPTTSGGEDSGLGPVLEDTRIRKSFVHDLAAFLVTHFLPSDDGGSFTVRLSGVNRHCANRLDIDPNGGKAAVLQYAFQPAMLKALYGFYVDYFLHCLRQEALKKWPSKDMRGQFYINLSQYLDQVQSAMHGVLLARDLSEDLKNYEQKAEIYETLAAQVAVANYDLNQLGEEESEKREAARALVQDLQERQFRALRNRERAQTRLLAVVQEKSISALDDDSLLFLVLWMQRRLNDSESDASMWCAIEILQDLNARLEALSVSEDKQDNEAPDVSLDSQASPKQGRPSMLKIEDLLPKENIPKVEAEEREPERPKVAVEQNEPISEPKPEQELDVKEQEPVQPLTEIEEVDPRPILKQATQPLKDRRRK